MDGPTASGAAKDAEAAIRVLLADDHEVVRKGVQLLLETEADIDVVGEAASGEEAVALAAELSPDVVVMDVSMPGMNGIQATARIQEEVPTARVLALTMHDRPEDIQDMLDAGAAGYVVKDSAVEQLVQAIRSLSRTSSLLLPARAARLWEHGRSAEVVQRHRSLTVREKEVVRLAAQGLKNAEIADRLCVSVKTVQTHRGHVMEKLGLHDRVDLVRYAVRHGLCEA